MEEKFERCVKNVLWKRGYTLKRYRKGKLITQKRKTK
jgi:hypothetical protein